MGVDGTTKVTMVTNLTSHGEETKYDSDGSTKWGGCRYEGVNVITDFEAIEIVDDINPYPNLLGIDWAFDMYAIINLKCEHHI